MSHPLEVLRLELGPFLANCFLLRRKGEECALVIDPGFDGNRIEEALMEWGAEPAAILLTHAHIDHVAAVGPLVRVHSVPVYLHPDDLALYEAASQ